MNRTSRPLSVADIPQMHQVGLVTKQLVPAWIASVNGFVYVQPSGNPDDRTHYGKYWIKFSIGQDGDGNTIYSQPERATVQAYDVRPIENFPVLVRQAANGSWIIEKCNYTAANRSGFDTRQLNPNDGRKNQVVLRQVWNGRAFSSTTAGATTTSISIAQLFYQWEGVLKNTQKDQSIDLSASIPGAGLERLTLVGIRAHDNTVQTIDGTTRSVTTAKFALSDTDELIGALDDYTLPIAAYRLADSQTIIDEADVAFDARQFVNVQQPRGAPTKISRHTLYLDGYQDQVFGSCEVLPGGSLEVRPGGGFLVI